MYELRNKIVQLLECTYNMYVLICTLLLYTGIKAKSITN